MDVSSKTRVTNCLREERILRHLRQRDVAEQVGTSVVTVRRWEQGTQQPHAYFRLKLCTLFGKTAQELGLLKECQVPSSVPAEDIAEVAPATISEPEPVPLWTVPFARNPYFTGRDEVLEHLHSQLSPQKQDQTRHVILTQTQAISGLGGIGKTQMAIEYAYRHAHEYAAIFWIGAETSERLASSFVTLAEVLNLPEQQEHDQNKVITAVLRWLTSHQGWLLIFDNVEDLDIAKRFVPTAPHGSILVTTRLQALGTLAQQIEVETMGMVEGVLFLLRRAKVLAPDTFLDHASPEQLAMAEALVIDMDFLPLALDQAGAYIEEAGCSLSTYLELYRTHRKELLQRRGQVPTTHPDSVTTTWSLNFQRVEQTNPAAADLLRLCTFLEPDSIPEELFTEGSPCLGPILQPVAADALALNAAIEELRKLSLVHRDPNARQLQMHRLVQAVLKDAMEPGEQRLWAERVIRATNTVFPDTIDPTTWLFCRRFLSLAQICSTWITDFSFVSSDAASLLLRTAHYLRDAALYTQAELLFHQVVFIREQLLKQEHASMAHSLNGLADLYRQQGKYSEAEQLYQQVLRLWDQSLGPEHLQVATPLNGLALLYSQHGRYGEAEPLFQKALSIREQNLGSEHIQVAASLNGLADLYLLQGKYREAEPLFQRAVQIREQHLGSEHPQVANPLTNLAILYFEQRRYQEAELLFQRALSIREQGLGPEHPLTAISLTNLGEIYNRQGRYEEAEPLFQQAEQILRQSLGPEHPNVSLPLHNLAELYRDQGNYEEAEKLFRLALRILEQNLGSESPDVAYPLHNLAELYRKQGKCEEAEPLYQRALSIRQRSLGLEHPQIAASMGGLANLHRDQGKYEEAKLLFQQAFSIRERCFGPDHLFTAETLGDLAAVHVALGEEGEAFPLYQRALHIWEQALGPDHPNVANVLSKLAELYSEQGKYAQAEPLYLRSLCIWEKTLGPDHQQTTEARTRYVKFLEGGPGSLQKSLTD